MMHGILEWQTTLISLNIKDDLSIQSLPRCPRMIDRLWIRVESKLDP
jgi:hypothetical protein